MASGVVLTIALAGCGGGADNVDRSAAPGASGASTGASASSPEFDKAAASARAKTANLVISDFPTGWAASPQEPEMEDAEDIGRQLAKCLNAPAALFDDDQADAVSADSPDFNSPDEEITISSSVAVAAPGKVQEFLGVMKGDKVSGCLTEGMEAAIKAVLEEDDSDMAKQAKFGKPKVGQLSFPAYGDESVPLRVSMDMSLMGLTFDFYLDMLYIRSGDNGVFLTFMGMNKPVAVEMEQRYAGIAAERLAGVNSST